MTTPTQAQIEAARDSARSMIDYLAKAAFAAAATPEEISRTVPQIGAIAAAEVGEQDHIYMRGYVDGGNETKAATIERCAQLAETFHCAQCGADAAAAIRKLKDEAM